MHKISVKKNPKESNKDSVISFFSQMLGFKSILLMNKRIGRGLKHKEPSPARIIYKGTQSHTQSHSNMSTSNAYQQ